VLVLVGNAVVGSASEQNADPALAQRSYLDQVVPALERSNQQIADVADLRNRGSALGAESVTQLLTRVQAESRGALDAVASLEPPEQLRTANALLVASLTLRSRAAETLETGYSTALSASATDASEAVALFQSAGADLLAADRTYAAFVQAVTAAQVQLDTNVALPEPLTTFDSLTWDPLILEAYVDSIRAAGSSASQVDAAVVLFTTSPGVLRVQDGVSVLPPGEELSLAIVVANTGNSAFKGATVQVTLTPNDGSPVIDRRDFVDLESGERRTVKLGGIAVPTNVASTLTVEILPVAGEVEVANNVKTLLVAVLSTP
jgi:hypothetical protein